MLRSESEHLVVKYFSDASDIARFVTQSLAAANIRAAQLAPIPKFLPYLCDRSDQEYELRLALQESEKKAQRPLVCIIHGEETEAHDRFLERLQNVMLPELLSSKTQYAGIQSCRVEWPTSFRSPQEMRGKLVMSLSKAVLNNAYGSPDEINSRLLNIPAPSSSIYVSLRKSGINKV
jgi:hypothetical protein